MDKLELSSASLRNRSLVIGHWSLVIACVHDCMDEWGIGVLGCWDIALIQQIINLKGSHGLHQDSLRLRIMTALIKSFCGGSRGAVFSKSAPLAAGGKNKEKEE